ncbi:MAG TPA: hypothetical protein VN368_00860 [Candidatus Methylomirabilis sp.]|nr:hypothetical protein [Candidatus Methylomirabilis sp.]
MFIKNLLNGFSRDECHTLQTIKTIFVYTYVRLSLLFVIAVFLKEMHLLPEYFLNYILFGYLLPVFALPLIINIKKADKSKKRIEPLYVYISISIIFIFTLAIRFLPYLNNSIPLGYDPGYYKYMIDVYINVLPDIPESSLPIWIKGMNEQGSFVLFDALHIFSRMSSIEGLNYFFPLLSTFIMFPIFILTRMIFEEKVAILACALYAVSYTQLTAFTFLYLKNIFGLFFLLLALYSLEKKKYTLIALMAAALGIYHRPEFLIFSLILACYLLKDRDKNLIYSILLMSVLIAPFWIPRIEMYFSMISSVSDFALQSIQGDVGKGGTFFNFEKYEWISLSYLPFGIIGALYLFTKKKWNSLLLYFTINGIIVIFKLFFFNRLIIDLDIVLLILASAGILYTFLISQRIPQIARTGFIFLLLLSGGAITLQKALKAEPLMNEKQLRAIEWISENTETNAFVLTTSFDAPWALAWSNRRVLAPGLFEWNIHGEEEWLGFLATNNSSAAEKFLDQYNGKIYIYYSLNNFNWMNLEKFNSTSFIKKIMEEAVIYRYDRIK